MVPATLLISRHAFFGHNPYVHLTDGAAMQSHSIGGWTKMGSICMCRERNADVILGLQAEKGNREGRSRGEDNGPLICATWRQVGVGRNILRHGPTNEQLRLWRVLLRD